MSNRDKEVKCEECGYTHMQLQDFVWTGEEVKEYWFCPMCGNYKEVLAY